MRVGGAAVTATLDHLVVAARDLPSGRAWLEARLGVPLAPGGEHARFGTHNHLLRLNDGAYLEVIAVNPEAPAPERPRWFGLDTPEVQARLAERPHLMHWVAQVPDLREALRVSPEDHGAALALTRGDLHWSLSVPDDGRLPLGGVLPSLIAWEGSPHPTTRLPDVGVRLQDLSLLMPAPERIGKALGALGLRVRVERADTPGLQATLLTPAGPVTLD